MFPLVCLIWKFEGLALIAYRQRPFMPLLSSQSFATQISASLLFESREILAPTLLRHRALLPNITVRL